MDGERFDALVRQFAVSPLSRRDALRLLLGSLAGSVLGGRLGRPGAASADRRPPRGNGPEIEYFALGDSNASGHGLMPTAREADGTTCRSNGASCCEANGDSCCRRSPTAYPHKVANELRRRYRDVHVHHFACSGATTRQLAGQVTWVGHGLGPVPTERPVLVSITVGANDFPWQDADKTGKLLLWDSGPVC